MMSLLYHDVVQVERQTSEMFNQMQGELDRLERELTHSRTQQERQARESTRQKQEDQQRAEKEVGGGDSVTGYMGFRQVVFFVKCTKIHLMYTCTHIPTPPHTHTHTHTHPCSY